MEVRTLTGWAVWRRMARIWACVCAGDESGREEENERARVAARLWMGTKSIEPFL